MRFKESAEFDPVFFMGPCGYAIGIVNDLAVHEFNGWEITVTSGCEVVEGRKVDSDHYKHRAWDMRIWDFPGEGLEVGAFAEECKKRLGKLWVVLVKSDHIHFGFKG